jgi:hypothetical protein
MIKNHNSRFTEKVQHYLDEERYEELFTEGCCYHFALRLHYDRNIPSAEFCSYINKPENITHVWLAGKDYDFDAKGVYEKNKTREVMMLRYDEDKVGKMHGLNLVFSTISPILLQKKIDEKALTLVLQKRLNHSILSYFDNDPKFQILRRI